ncbi:hypothetical protein C8R43DRAFT_1019634 [Mycena crocata]|nr:hypothetical protein C8R43DRAFT_1019634 [Mycena crocata]
MSNKPHKPPKPPKIPKLKLQSYRVPSGRHFLFIQNPWPFQHSASDSAYRRHFVNDVVGWLQCMIKDLCDLEIHPTDVALFWQSTHRDLIADIQLPPPDEDDDDDPKPDPLGPVLGAHHSRAFLRAEYAGTRVSTSVIYDYDFVRFNSPRRTNWSDEMAHYTALPPNFPIKRSAVTQRYPAPGPTDIPRLKLTKRLPGRLILGDPACVQQPTQGPIPNPNAPNPGLPPPPTGSAGQVVAGTSSTARAHSPTPARTRSTSPGPSHSSNRDDENGSFQANSSFHDRDAPTPPPRATPLPLPLPLPARDPTPTQTQTPNPFAFTPYERPPHFPAVPLVDADADVARTRTTQDDHLSPTQETYARTRTTRDDERPSSTHETYAREKLTTTRSIPALKPDPYEEDAAAQAGLSVRAVKEEERDTNIPVKFEPHAFPIPIKSEPDTVPRRVKTESVKTEAEDYTPTPGLSDMWEEMRAEQARRQAAHSATVEIKTEVKEEEQGYTPTPGLAEGMAAMRMEQARRRAAHEAGERSRETGHNEHAHNARSPVNAEQHPVKLEQRPVLLPRASEPSSDFLTRAPEPNAGSAFDDRKIKPEPMDARKRPEPANSQINPEPAEMRIKPEPADAPLPRARPFNRSFDPFQDFEPNTMDREMSDVGESRMNLKQDEIEVARVKREGEGTREFNVRQGSTAVDPRQGSAAPPSSYPRGKHEEFDQRDRREEGTLTRSASRSYSPVVKQEQHYKANRARGDYQRHPSQPPHVKQEEQRRSVKQEERHERFPRGEEHGRYPNRGDWHRNPPAPSAFPRGYSDYPQHNQGQAGPSSYPTHPNLNHNYDYSRQASGTFSPSPPRAVKRDRDEVEARAYSPTNEPPVKRERSEQAFSGHGSNHARYNTQHSTSAPAAKYSPTRDPRVRPIMKQEEHK